MLTIRRENHIYFYQQGTWHFMNFVLHLSWNKFCRTKEEMGIGFFFSLINRIMFQTYSVQCLLYDACSLYQAKTPIDFFVRP